jgi:hypothetical protein
MRDELYAQLLNSIDSEFRGGKGPVRFELVSDASEVPEMSRGNSRWIISQIPEPDPPPDDV